MNDRSVNLIVVSAVLGALASLAVALRFTARYIRGLRIWADDYLVLAAVVLAWGVCICNIIGASVARFGEHEIFQTIGPDAGRPLPELLILYGKICFACRLIHATAMQLLKLAVLLFFRRIFDQNRYFPAVFWTMVTYVVLWWTVCFWMNLFTCFPVYWTWSPSREMVQHCLPNYHAFFSYASLTNAISDFLITLIPFPFLFALRMSTAKKLAIAAMLATGAVVIVASIARTYAFFTVTRSPDYTYENYDYLIWTSVEPCVGVVGACLPTLRPLFTNNAFLAEYDDDDADSHMQTRTRRSRHSLFSSARDTRRASSVELALRADTEKGAVSDLDADTATSAPSSSKGTPLHYASFSEDSEGSAVALFNATPRLRPPNPRVSEPLAMHPVGAYADLGIGRAC